MTGKNTGVENVMQRAPLGRGRCRQRPPNPPVRFEGPFVATIDVYDDSYESASGPGVVPGIIVNDVTSKSAESVHRATPANVTRSISPTISAKINQYETNINRNDLDGKKDTLMTK